MPTSTRLVVIPLALLALALPVAAAKTGKTVEAAPSEALLDPSLATETAPGEFTVLLETTAGEVRIRVHRDWAPRGVDRFYNLVRIGFYDDTAFYRVIRSPKPFMAQIGFHGDPAVDAAWRKAPIQDDPVKATNTRGMVTFAKTNAPNSRTTQIFVNYADNSFLDRMGFAPFGEVVSGMEVVDELYAGYGEGAPSGKGPAQGRIASEGNSYLREAFPELDRILKATIVME